MVFFKRPILTFKSLYKNPWSNHSNETSSAVLSNTTFSFLVFYKTKFSIFLTFGQGKECTVIHNYCENNKFKENFYFVKTQNSKKQGSIAAVLSRFPCLIFVDRFTNLCRPRCGAAVPILIPLVKGRGILQNAECRMALFSEGQTTMLSCCLAPFHIENNATLRSPFYKIPLPSGEGYKTGRTEPI